MYMSLFSTEKPKLIPFHDRYESQLRRFSFQIIQKGLILNVKIVVQVFFLEYIDTSK